MEPFDWVARSPVLLAVPVVSVGSGHRLMPPLGGLRCETQDSKDCEANWNDDEREDHRQDRIVCSDAIMAAANDVAVRRNPMRPVCLRVGTGYLLDVDAAGFGRRAREWQGG